MAEKRKSAGTITPEAALALQGRLADASMGVTRVVILGGGFAGVHTAKYLTELIGSRNDVHVELLSDENYFVFQPLLPEVAAGGIAATHVVNPVRELVPKARFRLCKVRSVDFAKRRVIVSQGEGLELLGVPYDHLVFCLGKVSSFASMPGVEEHALPLKNLADAFYLRNHVLRCLERADIEPDADQRKALLTFVVAGGGFSGVETIGELDELVSRALRYFPRIRKEELSMVLIHSSDTLLPEMPKELGVAARKILEKRGVEMRLGARVRAASRDQVFLNDDTTVHSRTFVCTVGNAPNPVVRHALKTGGLEEATHNGRGIGAFAVEPTLACKNKPNYWAVGDCAGVPNPNGEGLCPPTAQFAIRQAKTCARNIAAIINHGKTEPFRFKALGMLASLGKRRAVADMMGIKLSGFIAWFLWRTVYLMKLPGFARRLRVALDWTLDLFFARDITQLDVTRGKQLRIWHFEPGELIIREGQIGRELFSIVHGEVEVLGANGSGEVLARLGPKAVFGERALLEDTPRTASVRAATPVDVIVVGRADFKALVDSFPALDDYFGGLLRERYPEKMSAHTSDSIDS
jgi:NADH:ubiquinone reductase (H+-translocating)